MNELRCLVMAEREWKRKGEYLDIREYWDLWSDKHELFYPHHFSCSHFQATTIRASQGTDVAN